MNDIRTFPGVRHIRTEPSTHVIHYRRGKVARAGRGLAFWFRPLTASIVQVPLDDRELELLFHGRTADFQDVTAQGVVTFRVTDPELLSHRIDFTIDLQRGTYRRSPLDQLASLVGQLAQGLTWEYIASTPLTTILVEGVDEVRSRILVGLATDPSLVELGIETVAVRIAAIRPTSEVEQALQTPARERMQQDADEATFRRRAAAVEKERAIEENELQNRIELSRRHEQLVAQQGANARLEATEAAEVGRVRAEAEARQITLVEGANVAQEAARIEVYRTVPTDVLLALAAQTAAGKLQSIEHLNLTPDLLGATLTSLASAGTRRLASGE